MNLCLACPIINITNGILENQTDEINLIYKRVSNFQIICKLVFFYYIAKTTKY